jgi:antitoxin MazE
MTLKDMLGLLSLLIFVVSYVPYVRSIFVANTKPHAFTWLVWGTVMDVYPSESGMQVAKWGNSLAIRLPAAVVAALKLREGDEIEIHVVDERELAVARKPGRAELLNRLRSFRGRLPPDFKFDRDEANAR